MDIDYILNGKKKIPFDSKKATPTRKPKRKDPLSEIFSNKKKSNKKDPLRDLFIGKGNPIVGDRITRKQAKVFKGPSKDLFGDWDGDGVINALDCQPINKNKHMPNMYTWQSPNQELAKNPSPAYDTTNERMDSGRSTGWTGTGIYTYKSKQKALKEGKDMGWDKERELYSIDAKKPKVFTNSEQFEAYEEASRAHKFGDFSTAQSYYRKAGIRTNPNQLKRSLESSKKSDQLPVNYLMKEKGYDAVVADDSNDTYRKGSVIFGQQGDFKNKLGDPNPENYDWNKNKFSEDIRFRRDKLNRDKIRDALEDSESIRRDPDAHWKQYVKDRETETYSTKYNDGRERQKLFDAARNKIYEKADEKIERAGRDWDSDKVWDAVDKTEEADQKYPSSSRWKRHKKQSLKRMSKLDGDFAFRESYGKRTPDQEVRDTIKQDGEL